jgi:hypothetical protein
VDGVSLVCRLDIVLGTAVLDVRLEVEEVDTPELVVEDEVANEETTDDVAANDEVVPVLKIEEVGPALDDVVDDPVLDA